MEGIFFVVHPVWWIIPISYTSILIAILWWVCIGTLLVYYHHKNFPKYKPTIVDYEYDPVDRNDTNYARKTLSEIRRYLGTRHYPKHSWAHIPQDIKSYSTDQELLTIIGQLEESEYSKIILDKNTLSSIHQTLAKKLRP